MLGVTPKLLEAATSNITLFTKQNQENITYPRCNAINMKVAIQQRPKMLNKYSTYPSSLSNNHRQLYSSDITSESNTTTPGER